MPMSAQQSAVEQLLDIMRQLRDPDTGCAWDIKQTFRTIAPFTLEEAYEVADAIERDDLTDLRDELGDLLFQVVFHAQMASEAGAFTFDDVARGIVDKMIRRHPHVFGDTTFETEAQLKAAWEKIKAEERLARQNRLKTGSAVAEGPSSALDGVAKNLPSLMRADKIQKRAARVGFDWPDSQPVWNKLDEELAELRQAVTCGKQSDIEDELGDVLFTVVNLARHCQVDSESAMQRASAKFEQRFRQVEALAAARGTSLESMNLTELDALWDEAKRLSLD